MKSLNLTLHPTFFQRILSCVRRGQTTSVYEKVDRVIESAVNHEQEATARRYQELANQKLLRQLKNN